MLPCFVLYIYMYSTFSSSVNEFRILMFLLDTILADHCGGVGKVPTTNCAPYSSVSNL